MIDLLGIAFRLDTVHEAVKPLLMPALVLTMLPGNGITRDFGVIVSALAFSWLGDIFLLFENYEAIFFMLGLGSFLVAHLFYIFYFLRIEPGTPGILRKRPILVIIVAAYCTGLYILLMPSLGPLKIPVLVYAFVIGCMWLSSMHAYSKVNLPAYIYFLAGALLFVLSDSLLALDKFYHKFPAAGVAVMLTYCAAQYFIVKGFLEKKGELSRT